MADITAERLAELSRDAAYVTIGLGVIAFQQAQVRHRAALAELDKHATKLKEQVDGLKGNADSAGQTLVDSFRSLEAKVSSLVAEVEKLVRSVDLPDVKLPDVKLPDLKFPDLKMPEAPKPEVNVGDKFNDVAKAGRQVAEDAYAHVVDLVRRGREQGASSVAAAETEYEAEVSEAAEAAATKSGKTSSAA